MDRELTLWESRIIMEYLDERFPHPPLMPVYPVARGESRLYMHRIEKDWYTLMNTIINGSASEADAARKQLREELLAIAPVFGQKPYFLSDEFSFGRLLSCSAAVASAATGHRVQRPGCERAERLYDPRL